MVQIVTDQANKLIEHLSNAVKQEVLSQDEETALCWMNSFRQASPEAPHAKVVRTARSSLPLVQIGDRGFDRPEDHEEIERYLPALVSLYEKGFLTDRFGASDRCAFFWLTEKGRRAPSLIRKVVHRMRGGLPDSSRNK